ncbi:phosphomannomutase [Candidatus Scalindua japonica]|uniref:Phosphomannomutase n=1 Tax=Candidatus Scalindua japonica TaxID=1284222 RepID=A0A286U3S1_9BACT|nr:phosphomannomutase/phosphoglucomutase [Candidatus Scalindua japonica]GAX62766.1 phosphomannomutase [Candidatus Scalindua japonica]
MAKYFVKRKLQCPGDGYEISMSVCRGRQRVLYPKCPVCRHRDKSISTSTEEVEEYTPMDTGTRKILQLSTNQDEAINRLIFKCYDIRGKYPEQLDEYTSEKIGIATVLFLKSIKEDINNIVVARDIRLSSNALASSLMKGITKAGVNVIDIGEVSTDTTYFAVGSCNYDAGIMVTASNNPSNYNGFKLCHEQAMPISFDTGLSTISEIARQTDLPVSEHHGNIIEKDIINEYKKFILSFATHLKPLKLVIDAGNGMAGKMIPIIFKDLPCKIVPLFFKPDGSFPNHEPNPLDSRNLSDLQSKVRETGSNLGVAFDGDADRCVFVDENGREIGCDIIAAIIARKLLQKEKGATILYDLRSSRILPEEIKKAGGNPYRERVGHSHIKAIMREQNAVFGGDLSGHYYFRKNYFADSALIALIEVLNILSGRNVPMSNLIAPLRKYCSTGEINFKVEDKDKKIEQIAQHFKDGKVDYLDGVTIEYSDWWLNVRKSNTEPLLRLNLEGKTKEIMEHRKKQVIDIIERE